MGSSVDEPIESSTESASEAAPTPAPPFLQPRTNSSSTSNPRSLTTSPTAVKVIWLGDSVSSHALDTFLLQSLISIIKNRNFSDYIDGTRLPLHMIIVCKILLPLTCWKRAVHSHRNAEVGGPRVVSESRSCQW